MIGPSNPMAPPLVARADGRGRYATVDYGHRFEGPPGCVQGGFLAAAFDVSARPLRGALRAMPAVTGTLTVQYRRPTPLHTELRFEGRIDRIVDRQVFCSARVLRRRRDHRRGRSRVRHRRPTSRFHGADRMTGPLAGLRVVEIVGLGPGPFCGMLLADLGAEVLRVDRADAARASTARGRRRTRCTAASGRSRIDLKHPTASTRSCALIEQADAFIEVFRPGCRRASRHRARRRACARNPRLVYGRLTGWGQDGPLARRRRPRHRLHRAGRRARAARPRRRAADAADQRARRLRRRRDAARASASRARCSSGRAAARAR